MKAIMVMFDALNRHMLPPYGCDWVQAPNFQRLARRSVTFENCYIGSMPCIPVRRELHTGRHNFLHRSWGPLEPFDDSMPQMLGENGVHTHLVTDHYHYFEDGGSHYHTRYGTWEFNRGQEGDPWKAVLHENWNYPRDSRNLALCSDKAIRQDFVNRSFMPAEEDHPQAQTFRKGIEFLETNHDQDNWFLQVEMFDPNQPFFAMQRYGEVYPHAYDGPHWDWPFCRKVDEAREAIAHMRCQYAALLSMCDAWLGRFMDAMDKYGLWQDTLFMVNTDHGFLLSEHGYWGLDFTIPFYNEIARIPLFVWDPRCGCQGQRRDALVQTIDLPATLLDYFGIDRPTDMQGLPLKAPVAANTPVREAALFGWHGAHVNVTDGRYVYMRAPINETNGPLYNYTVMPAHMNRLFSPAELKAATLEQPFPFTKGISTLRIPIAGSRHEFQTMLFDLKTDPAQAKPLKDSQVENRMIDYLRRLMRQNHAPAEQYERLGLVRD